MNASDQILYLHIDQLQASTTNPRKRFDDAKLQELANSIKSHGVLQPLLGRELVQEEGKPRRIEIIAGERRYRASKLAGETNIPVMIRNLTDTEVLHAQVIENLQRDDLHELEEAEGYERLLQEKDRTGQRYTAETIAAEIGKSRAYVYARLKLLDLCQEARDACYAGELDASTALLIARIPVHKLQIEALKEVTRKQTYNSQAQGWAEGDKALSYRAARTILQERYMLDLADAPFDIKDATLVPKSGSCTACTKRTGNQPELFDDVGSKDVCTDPVCHALKKTAHVLALQKKYEEKGDTLLIGKDAKKIIPKNYMKMVDECLRDHGLVDLGNIVPGDEQNRTWQQLLKQKKLIDTKSAAKPALAKTIIENPRNTEVMIETVNIEAATKALREAGFEITLKGKAESNTAASQHPNDKYAKEREKQKQELAIEDTFRGRLFDTLHTRIETDMMDPTSNTFPVLYRMVAVKMMSDMYFDDEDMLVLMRKFTTLPEAKDGEEIDWQSHITEFQENLPNFTPAQHLMLIIEMTLLLGEISTNYNNSQATTMLALAKELDIDADSLRKEAAAEHKAKIAAEKKAEKIKPKKAEQEAAPAAKAATVRTAAEWPFPMPVELEIAS